jgi:hypothetical protein
LGFVGFISIGIATNLFDNVLFFWALALNAGEVKEAKMVLPVGEKGMNIMPYVAALVIVVVFWICGYRAVRVLLGDYYWRASLLAASKNDGAGAYNLEIKSNRNEPKFG